MAYLHPRMRFTHTARTAFCSLFSTWNWTLCFSRSSRIVTSAARNRGLGHSQAFTHTLTKLSTYYTCSPTHTCLLFSWNSKHHVICGALLQICSLPTRCPPRHGALDMCGTARISRLKHNICIQTTSTILNPGRIAV